MTLKSLCTALLLGTSITNYAQDYLGFVNSNYAGITGAIINPANIVDSRMRFDMNLIGLNFNLGNNYLGIKREVFNALAKDGKVPDLQKNYLNQVLNEKTKSFFMSNRISGPAFMVNIDGKNAFGLSVNSRTFFSVDGVSEPLAELLYSDVGRNTNYNVNDLLGKNLKNKRFAADAMTWLEYGLTYARVIRDKDEHFLKAGITPKLLQGLASGYMNVNNFEFRFDNDPIRIQNDSLQLMTLLKTDVNYSHSANLDGYKKGFRPGYNFDYLGFGLDLGVVYEWRPDFEKHKFEMDGEKNLWRKNENKYKLKVGLSLLDLGSIKFDRGSISENFTIDVEKLQYRLLDINTLPILDFDKIVDSLAVTKPTPSTYKMATPTALTAQIDYQIYKTFYVNFTPYYAFQMKKRDAKVHDITVLSIAPRWDHQWFGVSVPVSYNTFYAKANQPVKVGAMLRLGPLVLGTNDLTTYALGDFFGANFYFLLKLPIPYARIRDRDNDGVSNKKDLCKNDAGTWEFKGCPDKDLDHVLDTEDKCPDVAGLVMFGGCPDTDLDSIPDAQDACPEVRGLKAHNGCPDSDLDGIQDKEDECPFVAGPIEFKGCPDGDGDGVADRDDTCPTVFGFKELKGCPDRDLDSIADIEDGCPEQAGPKENSGCPYADGDKDGIVDKDDACPSVYGIASLKGCPAITVMGGPSVNTQTVDMAAEEKKIIEKAFSSLEFATAKDIIKPTSFKGLDELAKLLLNHEKDWKIKLIGHTDNEGNAAKNMALSEKRANAVSSYLAKKGVPPEQLITEWHGAEQPVADNKTPAGRQRNRRVEMKIVLIEK